ncbi:MAG: L-threonylcarbamoyladenylate synthase [Tepidisphaeraceae bacterium]
MPSQQRADIRKAVEVLRHGGLVAFATETVYGLGADATNSEAVAKVFAAKGRPAANPLIVHVVDKAVAKRYVGAWPESAERLARAFWPGPLTMVVPKGIQIVPAVTAGLATMAIRCPDHPLAGELLREFDGPVAAPSANRSTRVSPTTADHVRQDLGKGVDLILDGGPCRVGIESTVIDLTSSKPSILRLGGIARGRLEEIVGPVEVQDPAAGTSSAAKSPGRQAIHYAPVTPAFRIAQGDEHLFSTFFRHRLGRKAIFLIIHGSELAGQLPQWADHDAIVELPSDAAEYARRLYAALREADDRHVDMIWIEVPPAGGQWDAARDRVHKATRPASEGS